MSAIKIIQNLARKSLIKNQGSGIRSIPNRMEAEAEAGSIVAILQNAGLPLQQLDDYIRSEKDLLKYLNIIKNANKPRVIAADSPEGRGITEALLGKRGKVVDFPQKRNFKQEIDNMIKDGTITKGVRGMKKSKKIKDREMFEDANKRLTSDVDSIIKDIQSMEPITAMKEANSVIARKGKYKNLTPEESKKILQDTEDHIFERYPIEDPEDFADGGVAGLLGERTGYFKGALADTKKGKAMSPGTSTTGGTRHSGGGGENGGTTTPKPKPKVKKNISTGSLTPTTNFLKKFRAHDKFTDQLKARRGKNYHELGGLDFMARFPNINPNIAKGLGTAYQYLTEGVSSLKNPFDNYTFSDAMDRAKEEARLNAFGIDAYANPDSSLYQTYANMVPESGAVPLFADGGPARQNFSMGKRAFLKLLGGAAAGIAGVKSGLIGMGGKGATKKAVTETVKSAGSTPPPYFFKLVDKIKTMGDDVTARTATQERQQVTKYKDYELTEDLTTGEKTIQKKSIEGDFDTPVPTSEEVYMNYKPGRGQVDEATGAKVADEYVEDTSYVGTSRGERGEIIDSVDGVPDEVIQEGTMFEDTMTEFGKTKKADGGIARMLGE